MEFDKNKRVYIGVCGGMLGRAVYEYFRERTAVKATDIDLNIDRLSHADVRNYVELPDSTYIREYTLKRYINITLTLYKSLGVDIDMPMKVSS